MLFYLPFFLLVNIVLTGILYYFWKKIPFYEIKIGDNPSTKISVVVSLRNESQKIRYLLEDLEKQSYPKELTELVLVDDHSTDGTSKVIEEYKETSGLRIRLFKMPLGLEGKKNAMAEGVLNAQGVLIVATDGDCRVGSRWLEALESFYREKKVKMITGAVTFRKEEGVRAKMLELEFASLVGSGASTMAMRYPSMCNGANLAYEKQAFIDVNGYRDSEKLASGDDEFLMHKIYRKYPGQVAFIKNKESLVETEAPPSWKAFYDQRRRWASKWESYTYTHVQLLALLIFGSNLALVINFLLWPVKSYPLGLFLVFLAFKFLLEFLFLRSVLVYFGRKLGLWTFLLTEMIYPFYVVVFAIAGRKGKYKWKDREIRMK